MKSKLLAVIGACCISGCAAVATANMSPVAATCAASSAAIKTLSVAYQAGILSPVDKPNVDAAIMIVAPICTAPVEPSLPVAQMTALANALLVLQKTATHYEGI